RFFFPSRRRHTSFSRDWSSDVCSSDLFEQVVVTVLCGRRPDLLEVTLATLRATAPGLLDTAHVIVLHNGADPETGEVVDRHRGVVNQVINTTELLTCGQGTSRQIGRAHV